ncbi:MAG: hypothetical protein ACRCVS_03285 [Fusobacteriaceae bacterium]
MKKNKGFILYFTLVCITFICVIFFLFTLSLKNKVDIQGLYENSKIDKANLKNISSLVFWEFEKIDDYIVKNKIKNIQDYIFTNILLEKLWTNPHTRKSLSLGGFHLFSTTPKIETIKFSGEYNFQFVFSKDLTLYDFQHNPTIEILLFTENINLICYFDKKDLSLFCNDEKYLISDFKIQGKVLTLKE